MEENEIKTTLCTMPWCRVRFAYDGDEAPTECPKCRSFDRDLSGGVTWTEKKYEGSRDDGMFHPIDIRVQKAGDRKRIW